MWYSKYVGIPYKEKGRDLNGTDCWGLTRLIYSEQYNIQLPSFSAEYALSDIERITDLLAQYKEGWIKLETPKIGSIVLFRIMGAVSHVGVVVSDNLFIHSMGKNDTVLGKLDSISWRDRIDGYYEYSENSKIALEQLPTTLKTLEISGEIIEGKSIGEILEYVVTSNNIVLSDKDKVVIFINGEAISTVDNCNLVPKVGDKLTYRLVSGEGIFRAIATIVLIVVALEFFQPNLLSFFTNTVGLASSTATFAATATISLGVTLLVSALFPIRQPEQNLEASLDPGSSNPMLMLTGSSNEANRYGSIPVVLGQYKIMAAQAAQSYVVMESDTTYLRMLLTWGYGPIAPLEQIRVGAVPLQYIESVNVRHYPWSTYTLAETCSIYGKDTWQTAPNFTLKRDSEPATATEVAVDAPYKIIPITTTKVIRIKVDIHFPQGLREVYREGAAGVTGVDAVPAVPEIVESVFISDDTYSGYYTKVTPATDEVFAVKASAARTAGGSAATDMYITLQYASYSLATGVRIGLWVDFNITSTLGTTPFFKANLGEIYSNRKDAFTISAVADVPELPAGQSYMVQAKRYTPDEQDADTERGKPYRYNTSVLALVTASSNTDKLLTEPKNNTLAVSAFVIKATGTYQNAIEGINALVKSLCYDYVTVNNSGTLISGWTNDLNISYPSLVPAAKVNTSNPASLFRYILQHPASAQIVPDSRIDLSALQVWHTFCKERNFTYNAVITEQRSLLEILRDICAAGRGSPTMNGDKWSVVFETYKYSAVQFFTPHNSWGFESTKSLVSLPDALRVNFTNASKDYQNEEILVYNDGFTEANATVFESISFPGVTDYASVYKHARFHLAQTKLRPETYSLNADIEHLVCTRGDLVRVTHDVPMWGMGTGRIKTYVSSTYIELDEEVILTAGVSNYVIKVRGETGTAIQYSVAPVSTTQGYTFITLTTPASEPNIRNGNLFLFGEVNKESVELIVLAIEPSTNMTAKITLVDYSPGLITASEAYNSINGVPAITPIPDFNSKITLPAIYDRNFITTAPIVDSTKVKSDESVMSIVGNNYVFKIVIPYTNPSNLDNRITSVECRACLTHDYGESWRFNTIVKITNGAVEYPDVLENGKYTIQLRYTNSVGFAGPWCAAIEHTVIGRSTLPPNVSSFVISNNVLSWDPIKVVDLAGYRVKIHYGFNTEWESALSIHDELVLSSPYTPTILPSGQITLLVKAVDTAGNESLTPSYIVKDYGDIITANLLETYDYKANNWPSGGTVSATNLFTYSQNFNGADWSLSGATSTISSTIEAPDGTYTASLFTIPSLTGLVSRSMTGNLIPKTISIYAKAGTINSMIFRVNSFDSVLFDILNGNFLGTSGSTSMSVPSITSVGGGWFRCSIVVTIQASYTISIGTYGPGNILLWGAQAEVTKLRNNIISSPNNFLSSIWNYTYTAGGSGSMGSNSVTAPDGTSTAGTLTLSANSSGDAVSLMPSLCTTTAYTSTSASIWLKSTSGTSYTVLLTFGGVYSSASYPSLVTVTSTWTKYEIVLASCSSTTNILTISLVNGTTSSTASINVWGANQSKDLVAYKYVPTDYEYIGTSWVSSSPQGTYLNLGNLETLQASEFYNSDSLSFFGTSSASFFSTVYESILWDSYPYLVPTTTLNSYTTLDFSVTGVSPQVYYKATNSSPYYLLDIAKFHADDSDTFYSTQNNSWVPWPGSTKLSNQEYQWRVATTQGTALGVISKFKVLVDVPDITLILNDISIGIGGTRLIGAINMFTVIKNVQLTLQGSSTATLLKIVDKNSTLGPLVLALDSSGNSVSAIIDAHIQGY